MKLTSYCSLTRLFQLSCNDGLNRFMSLSVGNYSQFENKRMVSHRRKNRRSVANPGISQQLKIVNKDSPNIESLDLSEADVDDLEADFLNARQMKDYHISEARKMKYRVDTKITQQKHFKSKVAPNMLTWSDKEQIRLLNKQDPQVWNIDKLSESFPATPEIIEKILKSNWNPESSGRIQRHDASVASNWKAFNNGELVIEDLRLKNHLQKFTKRNLLQSEQGHLKEVFKYKDLQKPNGSEFVSIIRSYVLKDKNIVVEQEKESGDDLFYSPFVKTLTSSNKDSDNHSTIEKKNLNQLNNYDTNYDSKDNQETMNKKSKYTLDQFRNTLKMKTQYLDKEDTFLIRGAVSESAAVTQELRTVESVPFNTVQATKNDYGNVEEDSMHSTIPKQVNSPEAVNPNYNSLPTNNSNHNLVSPVKIPLRIHIPKNKVKVGYIYKVKDCFYSHDGFFLYKVPGIE